MCLPWINLTGKKNPSPGSKRRAGILTVNSELTFNPPALSSGDGPYSKQRGQAEGSCSRLGPLSLIIDQMPVLPAWLQARSSAQPVLIVPHVQAASRIQDFKNQCHYQDPGSKATRTVAPLQRRSCGMGGQRQTFMEQQSLMGRVWYLGLDSPGLQSWLHPRLSVWSRLSYLTSLEVSFSVCTHSLLSQKGKVMLQVKCLAHRWTIVFAHREEIPQKMGGGGEWQRKWYFICLTIEPRNQY